MTGGPSPRFWFMLLCLFVEFAFPGALFCAPVTELPEESVRASTVEDDQELSPGAVTVIRPAERRGEQKNLPDLLETVPGLRIIRLNGRNGYSVASVRGSTSSQVAIYVDGVLANLRSEAAVDLSTIPIDSVERIEVYRGYIPARFGAQAMGGVINVVTKSPGEAKSLLSLGVGSYGRFKGGFSHAGKWGGGRFLAAVHYETSEGDYTYFNDNGTPYTPDDDYTGKRRDNTFENTDVLLKWEDENWTLRSAWMRHDRDLPLAAPGLDRRDGSPQKHGALLDTRKYELSVARRQRTGDVEWGARVEYVNQTKDYDSRRGTSPSQIGGAYVTTSRYETERIAYGIDANAAVGKDHFLELLFGGHREELDVGGRSSSLQHRPPGGAGGTVCRGYELQLQDTIALDRAASLVLTPSLRWHAQNGVEKLTWQIAAKKHLTANLVLKATGGTYSRAPNIYERHGDGAFILPAKDDLKWEEGSQWDVGVLWRTKIGSIGSSMILTCFDRKSENLIEFDMESPRYGRYRNIADARVRGVEMEWALAWEAWDLMMTGTYLDAVNETPDDSGAVRFEGKRLPNRPKWAASARLTRALPRGSAYAEVVYAGDNYGDSSEKIFFDARTLWNVGVKYAVGRNAKLFVGVDDLFDQADEWKLRPVGNGPTRMLWYPTEGRYFYATLEYTF